VLDDRARLQRMLDFEAALARAAAAVGVIPAGAAGQIAEGCRAGGFDIAALAEAAIPAGNLADPLVAALTAAIAARNPQAAGYVHWGATAQDVIDTAMVLELRAAIDVLLDDIDRACRGFTALAGRHRRAMSVARTMMQQALPMPFGLKLAAYAAALARSRERLRRLRKEALLLQFGGAAGTLAALGDKGLDVSERLAAQLDLPLPDAPWHTHRDRLAEVAAALAILAGTCGKIARDVALMMQSEVGEVFEASGPGGDGSATLPRNRNPIAATAALSAAMAAPGLAATLLAGQIQEHERAAGAWQSEWITFPALALVTSGTLAAVADIAEGLEVDVERMKSHLEQSGGLVMAEAICFALAAKLGRSPADALVRDLSERARAERRPFREVVEADPRVKAAVSGAELARLFLPTSYQGTAQTFIDRLIGSAQGRAVIRRSPPAEALPAAAPAPSPEPAAPPAAPQAASALLDAFARVTAAVDQFTPAPAQPEKQGGGTSA
jgi:3-carboxy-cis,cis-muconate cycloisomerase